MSFDIKSLELFIRVASLGAIGKAGEEFNLSSTAASQRIQSLENVLGRELFHRTTRTVSLTSDGEVFLKHALRILNEVEDVFSYMHETSGQMQGEIKVACSSAFARKYITPYISEFLTLHPNLSLYLDASDTVVDIIEGGFDLSIRLGVLDSSSLRARKIASSPRIIVASPGYLEKNGTPKNLETLVKHNCLMRGDKKGWRVRDIDGVERDIKLSGNFTSNHAESITEAALAGLGIARKCKWEISEYLDSGELISILNDYQIVPKWHIYALRSPARSAPARVRAFVDFLVSKFKNIPALQND